MYTSKERASIDVTSKDRAPRDVYFQGESVEGMYTSKERVWRDVYFQGESVEGCILLR